MTKWKFIFLIFFCFYLSCQNKTNEDIQQDVENPIISEEPVEIEKPVEIEEPEETEKKIDIDKLIELDSTLIAYKPILPDNEVIAFFEKQLPWHATPLSKCFFVNEEDDKCILINSYDDFRNCFSCTSDMLPAIDFESCTLIIGQQLMPMVHYSIFAQIITVGSQKNVAHIIVDCLGGLYASFGTLYFWGLYPKIEIESISVNIINICRLYN